MSAGDFHYLAHVLESGRSELHPAEAHGCLCGALCASAAYTLPEWLEELRVDAAPDVDEAARTALEQLFRDTRDAFEDQQMAFSPLLPADDTPMALRAAALGAWCQGFLYGFGAAGHARGRGLSEDVEEVLADFAQMTRASDDDGTDDADDEGDEQERAYAELVEFLRAAAQLVYDELEAARSQQRTTRHAH